MFSYCDECPFSCCNSNGECTSLSTSCECPNSSSLLQCKYCCAYSRCFVEAQKSLCPTEVPSNVKFWVFLIVLFCILCLFGFCGIICLKFYRKRTKVEITLDPIIHLEFANNFVNSQNFENHQIDDEIPIIKENLPPLTRTLEENGIPLVNPG